MPLAPLPIDAVLPRVSANLMSGLIEAVAGPPYNGKADLPLIASSLHMEVDDLFPVAESLQMLRFAEIEGVDSVLMIGSALAVGTAELRVRPVPRANASVSLFIIN